jgi:hypothetical protein
MPFARRVDSKLWEEVVVESITLTASILTTVRKTHFLSHFIHKSASCYQDRLGTNTGKTPQKYALYFFSGGGGDALRGVRRRGIGAGS